jgi:hypothetical protein
MNVGDLAVERHGGLQRHVRPPLPHRGEEGAILPRRLGFPHSHRHVDSRAAQLLEAASGDDRVRVLERHDHPSHARRRHDGGAGRRPSPVGAGFERHVERGAASALASHGESLDFGVRASGRRVEGFAHHLARGHHDGAYQGIG